MLRMSRALTFANHVCTPFAFSSGDPTVARSSPEQLEKRTGTACFNDPILLVGLARMLAFTCAEQVHLASTGSKRASILPPNAKQNEFSDITEIETDAAPVGAAVFTYFVPNEIGLVIEPPSLHHRKAIRQERIGAPQIKVCSLCCKVPD